MDLNCRFNDLWFVVSAPWIIPVSIVDTVGHRQQKFLCHLSVRNLTFVFCIKKSVYIISEQQMVLSNPYPFSENKSLNLTWWS